jgi:hypothetical protein
VLRGELQDHLARDDATRRPLNAALRTTAADPKSHRAFLMRTSLLESVRR